MCFLTYLFWKKNAVKSHILFDFTIIDQTKAIT